MIKIKLIMMIINITKYKYDILSPKLNKKKIFVIKNKIKPQIYFEKIQTKNYHRNSKKNRKTEKN